MTAPSLSRTSYASGEPYAEEKIPEGRINGHRVNYQRNDDAAAIIGVAGGCLMLLGVILADICRVNRNCTADDWLGTYFTAATGAALMCCVACFATR